MLIAESREKKAECIATPTPRNREKERVITYLMPTIFLVFSQTFYIFKHFSTPYEKDTDIPLPF